MGVEEGQEWIVEREVEQKEVEESVAEEREVEQEVEKREVEENVVQGTEVEGTTTRMRWTRRGTCTQRKVKGGSRRVWRAAR